MLNWFNFGKTIYKDKNMRYGSHASTLNAYELDFTIIEEYNFMKYLGIV